MDFYKSDYIMHGRKNETIKFWTEALLPENIRVGALRNFEWNKENSIKIADREKEKTFPRSVNLYGSGAKRY